MAKARRDSRAPTSSSGTCQTGRTRATTRSARLRAPLRRNHARSRQSPSRPRQLESTSTRSIGAQKGRRQVAVHSRPSARGRCQPSRQDRVQQQDHRGLTSAGRNPGSASTLGTTPLLDTTARHDLVRSPYSAGGCGIIVCLRSHPRRNHAGSVPRPKPAQRRRPEYRPKNFVAQRGREPCHHVHLCHRPPNSDSTLRELGHTAKPVKEPRHWLAETPRHYLGTLVSIVQRQLARNDAFPSRSARDRR